MNPLLQPPGELACFVYRVVSMANVIGRLVPVFFVQPTSYYISGFLFPFNTAIIVYESPAFVFKYKPSIVCAATPRV